MTQERRRHAAVATFAGNSLTVAITVVQAFLLVPLCLSSLGVHLYGAWLGAYELLVWVQSLDLGIPNLLTQRIGGALGRGDRLAASKWSTTGLMLLGGGAVVLGVLGGLVAVAIPAWARVEPSNAATFVDCFRIGVLASVLLLLSNGVVGIARGMQRTALITGAQVAGAAIGLLISILLLTWGWGLWALAAGLLVRALVVFGGGIVFFWQLQRTGGAWLTSPSRAVAGDIRALLPSTAGATAGTLVANNTELILVTTVLGPVAAAVYALTRRVVDGLKNLLDSVAWAVYGGFAHLVGEDRDRARDVLRDILWLRLALASLAGAVAVAVNESFVVLLFGRENFGGLFLSVAFAIQMIVGGQAFLASYLYRAAGYQREGANFVFAEGIVRATFMAAAILLVGALAVPVVASIVGLAALLVVLGRLKSILPPSTSTGRSSTSVVMLPVVVMSVGVAVAALRVPPSWMAVVVVATGVAAAGGFLLWTAHPSRPLRAMLPRRAES